MSHIYLHIGLPKTGTTTIQQSLYRQSKQLANIGIYYPKFTANHGTYLYSIFCTKPHLYKTNLAKGIDTYHKANLYNKQLVSKIDACLKNNTLKKILISGEKLCYLQSAQIKSLASFLKNYGEIVKIIVYVRNPIDYATSWVQQSLKSNKTLNFFLNNPPLPNYKKRIQPWLDTFGQELINIRSFEHAIQHQQCLLGDFFNAIEENLPNIKEIRKNESLCLESVQVINSVNKIRPLIKHNKKMTGRCLGDTKKLFTGIKGTKFSLPKNILKQVLEKSQEDIEWLYQQTNKNIFGPEEKWLKFETYDSQWSDETLQQIGLKMYDLYAENLALKKSIDELSAQLQKFNGL